MFSGVYNEKTRHPADREEVISRSMAAKCDRLLILGGSVEDSASAIRFAEDLDASGRRIFATAGVHPTRAAGFDDEGVRTLASNPRVVALGEMGLDSDRLHFCPMDVQLHAFRAQISIARELGHLPLLLHFRGSPCFQDFVAVLSEVPGLKGVVHSFTGTLEEMHVLTGMGFSIGINGCSLREEAFLTGVLPFIPADKLLFETDSPYCDIRPTHASFKYINSELQSHLVVKPEKMVKEALVKGRNEPCLVSHVAEVVAAIHPSGREIIRLAYRNAMRLFPRFKYLVVASRKSL
jgi:TatD DNase family protein